jgi:spore coat protein U-like protein
MALNKAASIIVLLTLPLAHAMACSLSVVNGVAFASYDIFNSSPNVSTGALQVSCTEGETAPFTLTLDTGSSGTYSPRKMQSGSYVLNYNLYTNPSYSSIWGDGTSGTAYVSGNAADCITGCQFTIYGRTPALQNSAGVGSYSDTITATLSF